MKKKRLEPPIIRDELFSEYRLNRQIDFPNPFSEQITESSITITLDPDVAKVFKTSEDVNDVLRYLLSIKERDAATKLGYNQFCNVNIIRGNNQ